MEMKIFLLALWWDCIYYLRFNLLFIQFIVDSSLHKLDSCNYYIIVDIFQSCPMIFFSTPEGFSRKIWCSFVVVFL